MHHATPPSQTHFIPPYPTFNGHSKGFGILPSNSLNSLSSSLTPTARSCNLSSYPYSVSPSNRGSDFSPYPELGVPLEKSSSTSTNHRILNAETTTSTADIGVVKANECFETLHSVAQSIIGGNVYQSVLEEQLRSLQKHAPIFRFEGIDQKALGLDEEQWKILIHAITASAPEGKSTLAFNIFKKNILQAELERITMQLDLTLSIYQSKHNDVCFQETLNDTTAQLKQLAVSLNSASASYSAQQAGEQIILCEMMQILLKINKIADSNTEVARKLSLAKFTPFSIQSPFASLIEKLFNTSPNKLSEAEKALKTQFVQTHEKISEGIDKRIERLELYLQHTLKMIKDDIDSIRKRANDSPEERKRGSLSKRERKQIESGLAKDTASQIAGLPDIHDLKLLLNELQLLQKINNSKDDSSEKEKEDSKVSSAITDLQNNLIDIESALLNFAITYASNFNEASVSDSDTLKAVFKVFGSVGYKASPFQNEHTSETPFEVSSFSSSTAVKMITTSMHQAAQQATTLSHYLRKGLDL